MRDVTARLGQVVVNNMANKPIVPLDVGHKVIHGKVNLVYMGAG